MAASSVVMVRTFDPVVDLDKCIKCGICERSCPEGTVALTDEGIIFDYRYCKGCGVCAYECPVKAIEMVRGVELTKRGN